MSMFSIDSHNLLLLSEVCHSLPPLGAPADIYKELCEKNPHVKNCIIIFRHTLQFRRKFIEGASDEQYRLFMAYYEIVGSITDRHKELFRSLYEKEERYTKKIVIHNLYKYCCSLLILHANMTTYIYIHELSEETFDAKKIPVTFFG